MNNNQTSTEIITYPAPTELLRSKKYSVKVNGHASFTYQVNGWGDYGYGDYNSWKTVSWTNFAFLGGCVTIEITANFGTIGEVIVRPLSLGIIAAVSGNTATFSIDNPCKISIEVDDHYLNDKLFLFADAPEINPPQKTDLSVTYIEPGTHSNCEIGPGIFFFGAGVHNLSENIIIASNTTLYLEGGAYVHGMFRGKEVENVKIIGRGIICGTSFNQRDGTGLINLSAKQTLIEGITMIDSPGWNLTVGPSDKKQIADNTFNNIKIIGMRLNADGIGAGGDRITINDIFIFSYDDAIDVGQGKYNVEITNCVLYMEKASALKISWNSNGCGNVHVKNISIIHYDTDSDYMENEAVIMANHSAPYVVQGILMEDITIETLDGLNKRFLGLFIRTSKWDREPDRFGSICDITIRNLNIMCRTSGNHICGLSAEHMISGIKFENLMINGEKINNLADADITVNEFTENIRFE